MIVKDLVKHYVSKIDKKKENVENFDNLPTVESAHPDVEELNKTERKQVAGVKITQAVRGTSFGVR